MSTNKKIPPFQFFSPTKVIFGEGTIKSIDEHIHFPSPLLIITGKESAQKNGSLDTLKKKLALHHKLEIYQGISANPRTSQINEASQIGSKKNVQAVVGIGGGSVIDAAKAAAACIGGKELVETFLHKNIPAPQETLPIIAIPTTAGTGSETSKGAIITDERNCSKKGLRGDALHPRYAIVDPELTYSLPRKITAETGFDILTHAIETFISNKATIITEFYSEFAIKTVSHFLPKLLDNLGDKIARNRLMLSSTLMGYNLANSSTCLPHRLQYPLGAHTDCSHPAGLAALYPAWCKNTLPYAEEKFAQITQFFSFCDTNHKNFEEIIKNFLEKIDIVYKMRDFNLTKKESIDLAKEVDGNLNSDPGNTSIKNLEKIYEESW